MGFVDSLQRKVSSWFNRPKVTDTFSLPDGDLQASKGTKLAEQEHQDEFSPPVPGAFPSSPPSSPQLVPSDRGEHHDVPVQEFYRRDSEVPQIPGLYTELAPHLRPLISPRQAPVPVQATPPPPVPPSRQRVHQGTYDFEDPYEQRARIYEKLPLGRHISAVQVVSPEKRAVPYGRKPSIWQREWDQQEKAKLAQELEQGRPVRIRPQGKCVRQLSLEWSNRVSKAANSSGAVAMSLSGDALYSKDIVTCIRPLAWLNDEIINAYLGVITGYLQESTGNAGKKPRYHAFSSYFYSNLRDHGYSKVSRWAKRAKIGGEGLLEVDTIFVPVHESAHWTLMVVRPIDRTIEYFDSLSSGRFSKKVDNIKIWLRGELGTKFVDDEWTVLPSVSSQQDNGSDCGVFLLTNAKAIALNIEPTAFGASDTRLLRQKIIAELMNGGLHGDFSPSDGTGAVLL